MCGIVGYIGKEQAAPILLEGLSRLEYRGYDSAGVCVSADGALKVAKAKGRLQNLREMTDNGRTLAGTTGIGHTRWATHGEPNDINSHPHLSEDGKIALVHNGIIENYLEIREFLEGKGVHFASETDSEVVAQLLEYYLKQTGTVIGALYMVLHRIEGAYALGILCADAPDRIYAARKDAPLLWATATAATSSPPT
jgi:glucosamine--fructose-6-phosphate aminotransferase (isomerizing)